MKGFIITVMPESVRGMISQLKIVRLSGLNCRVNPVTTAEYPTKTHRPAYSVLDKTKIKHTFGVEVPEWQEALRRMMGEISGEQRKEKI